MSSNLSTATGDTNNPLTVIGSNRTDLFRGSRSQIAGTPSASLTTGLQGHDLINALLVLLVGVGFDAAGGTHGRYCRREV